MELLVHISTSGHLLVVHSLEVIAVAAQMFDVHVIMATPQTPHHLLWAMTIFVRVFKLGLIGSISSIQMLHSGMVRFVKVVAHAASSTIHHGSPRT